MDGLNYCACLYRSGSEQTTCIKRFCVSLESHNYPLLEELSFNDFLVEEEFRESMRNACRVVRRVFDSGASTGLGKFGSSTTTLFNDVYSSSVDEELISMGKFCYAGGESTGTKIDAHFLPLTPQAIFNFGSA